MKTEHLEKIKRVKYNQKIEEIFDIEKMHGQMILIDKDGEIYNGKLILEYEDGKIHSEGNINFGMKTGIWKTYYNNGNLKCIENFENNKIKDLYQQFYETGEKYAEIYYKNGEYYGDYTVFHKNGNIQIKGFCREGLKEGTWLEYYENGNKKTETYYVNDKIMENAYSYYENGNTEYSIKFVNNKKQGLLEKYYEDGKLELQANFINDLPNGEWRKYYKKTGEISSKYFMKNGKKNGKYIEYYFKDTNLNGFKYQKKENEEGAVFEEYFMKNDLRDGKYFKYFPNGQIWEEGEYENDYVNGKYKYYSETKNLIFEENYEKGVLKEEIEYEDSIKSNIVKKIIYEEKDGDKIEHREFFNKNGIVVERETKINNYTFEITKYDENQNVIIHKKYRKRFPEKYSANFPKNLFQQKELNSTKNEIQKIESVTKNPILENKDFIINNLIETNNNKKKLAKKEADKKFDETRNWLGSRTERTLYKGSVFPVSRFIERIKDFDTDLKERVYRFIDSYTKDWISTITFDTGETYELEEALKKFREIMGLSKEEK